VAREELKSIPNQATNLLKGTSGSIVGSQDVQVCYENLGTLEPVDCADWAVLKSDRKGVRVCGDFE